MTPNLPPTPIPSPRGGRGGAPDLPLAPPSGRRLTRLPPPPWGREGVGGPLPARHGGTA